MLTVIYGGSGSGKSEYAEGIAIEQNNLSLYYIATMLPYDEESLKKIQRHKQMRSNKNFKTIECYTNLSDVKVEEGSVILLECMSNLIANEIFNDAGAKENTLNSVTEGIESLLNKASHLVIVTNNIFEDGVDYDKDTVMYLECLSKVNQYISKTADSIIEVIHGIAIKIKGN